MALYDRTHISNYILRITEITVLYILKNQHGTIKEQKLTKT
uniref:Uncharacterized protein n=1 Tax=Rhizophora mucronata TaxID=61149 RepID=A0A2P2QXF6_RHIMU